MLAMIPIWACTVRINDIAIAININTDTIHITASDDCCISIICLINMFDIAILIIAIASIQDDIIKEIFPILIYHTISISIKETHVPFAVRTEIRSSVFRNTVAVFVFG